MTRLGIAVAILLAIGAAAVAACAWRSAGDVTMSAADFIALIGGSLVTLELAAALIGRQFRSYAKGFHDKGGGRETLGNSSGN